MNKKLALITLKFLVKNEEQLSRSVFLSVHEREQIKKEYGERLPRNFPGPENGMMIGTLLRHALYGEEWKPGDANPYWDDADLIFPQIPKSKIFKAKVNNRRIDCTWKDLGEWLVKNMDNSSILLEKWLESPLSYDEFREKYKAIFRGSDLGLI